MKELDNVLDAGITGLKIEGRNKSIYYIGIVARAYRKALDAILHTPGVGSGSPGVCKKFNTKLKKELMKELETLNYRGYTTGFTLGKAKRGETYPSRQPVSNWNFVAVTQPLAKGRTLGGFL